MSPRLIFKALLKERLVAAAEEIFNVFESTIVKYEEEICTSKQEIARLKGLLVKSASNQKTGLFIFFHLISNTISFKKQPLMYLFCNRVNGVYCLLQKAYEFAA